VGNQNNLLPVSSAKKAVILKISDFGNPYKKHVIVSHSVALAKDGVAIS
jgi:hypothetical protein